MATIRFVVLATLLSTAAFAQRQLTGDADLRLSLEKLNVTGSVLMIAAHPDDENTAVLAYFARGQKLRTAYLSLNRGEGGQNLIGSEQGADIGLIRTQELLAARRIDGAEQFFTRAIDFGFSKTARETLQKWGHDQVLSDVVWIIRRYQPDVIVNRFSGTDRDGHGNHQVSAILGKEAFRAAADPARFPEQLQYVKPWQAKRIVWNVFAFTPEQEKEAAAMANRVSIDTGLYDPLLGYSYSEIAGMSRSQHRSQGMGSPERKGSSPNFFVPVDGELMTKTLFDGVDTTWNRVPNGAAFSALIDKAMTQLNPEQPERIVPTLLEARKVLQSLKSPIAERKLQELDEVLLKASGVWLEALADRFAATPGSSVSVTMTAIARSSTPVSFAPASIGTPGREPLRKETAALKPLPPNKLTSEIYKTDLPADMPISQPYWLARPQNGEMYNVTDQLLIGQPENAPVLTATFRIAISGVEILYPRPVRFRYVDPAEGELLRALLITPPVTIALSEKCLLFPSSQSRTVEVSVTSSSDCAPAVKVVPQSGWSAQPSTRDAKLAANESRSVTFTLQPPHDETQATMVAEAELSGRSYTHGMHVIRYSHIPPIVTFPEQSVRLVREDVRVLAKKIGYIMGAGDEVPEALRQMGCEVTLLSPDDLERGDLKIYDAVVAGVRAYNTRPDLRANLPRLMAYMENGGTYVMQYNVLEGGFNAVAKTETRLGPYPLKLSRDRVTVEEAPVTLLNPESPLLRVPNRITAKDFEGWVQERGLYFPTSWDDHYQPLLESHDPDGPPLKGGVLFARVGKGAYVYTGYAFFRQLPAGVPGAFRLFANLLSAGKSSQ